MQSCLVDPDSVIKPPGSIEKAPLNYEEIPEVDSSGLGAVVASMKQLRPGQTLELAALQPIVAKVFRLTRMDTIFTIHDCADMLGVTGQT